MAGETPKDPKIPLLGQKGVYLDQNPFTMPEGSWRRLLNGEFAITGARTRGLTLGGIRKRGGVAPWSGNLSGEILAVAGVPLASEMDFSAQLLLALNTGDVTNSWKYTTNGITFSNIAAVTAPRCYQNRNWAGVNFDEEKPPQLALYRRNLYYPSQNYTEANPPNDPPPVAVYTGDGKGYDIVDVGKYAGGTNNAYAITDMIGVNGLVYFCLFESSGVARVIELDPRFGTLVQIGNVFTPASGSAMCLTWYQNKLWVGTYNIPGTARGYIYSIRPDTDTAWVLEHTSAADNGGYHGLIVYGTSLYALTDADAIGTAIVEVRAASGGWSTSHTAPSAGTSRFSGAAVFNGDLYVGWYKWSATTASKIYKFNGSAWTADLDIKATYAQKAPGVPTVFGGALYWPTWDSTSSVATDNFLLKRTAAAVWSRPITGVALQGSSALHYPTP